ncbi:MAG: hypothetical protein Q8Q08_00050 [Candidatus Omnitrophota bacterium]|nr:hypothetical protein [Candidatus Omnitrophota bacterium]MDZ4342470.1 hypothetical protein [Candidatus Binatia bacterium]
MIKPILLTVFLLLHSSLLFADSQYDAIEDLKRPIYDELADIIQKNKQNPQECLAQVESYYQKNIERIKKIDAMTRALMAKYDETVMQALKEHMDHPAPPARSQEIRARLELYSRDAKKERANAANKKYEEVLFELEDLGVAQAIMEREIKYHLVYSTAPVLAKPSDASGSEKPIIRILRAASNSTEGYATEHMGNFPSDFSDLNFGQAFCGQIIEGFKITCVNKSISYKYIATPTMAGSQVGYQIETGGHLSEVKR